MTLNTKSSSSVIKVSSLGSPSKSRKLRSDQKKVLKELKNSLKDSSRVLFYAPTNYGKTRVYYESLFDLNLFPCVVCLPTYEACRDNLRELKENFDISNMIICVPMGKDKVKEECRKRGFICRSCSRKKRRREFKKFKIDSIRGRVIDVSRVLDETDFCPYKFLEYVAESYADIVVTSQKYVERHRKLARGKAIIVVDECDKAFEPILFKLFDYDVYNYHLQKEKEHPIERVVENLNRLREDPLRGVFSSQTELESFRFEVEHLRRILNNILARFLIPTEPQEAEREAFIKFCNREYSPENAIKIALPTAPVHVVSKAREANTALKHAGVFDDIRKYCSVIPPAAVYRSSLSNEEKELLLEFLLCGKRAGEIIVRDVDRSPERDGHGYLEVYLKAEENELQKVIEEEYQRKLYVTATPPKSFTSSSDIKLVGVDNDPYGTRKLVILYECEGKEREELVDKLTEKYSVLIITTSRRRAERCCKKYGGTLVSRRELDEIYNKGRRVYVDYYESSFSRGVNSLHIFDVVVVDDWIGRDPARESRLDYTDLYRYNAKRLYQHISRIFRTVDGEHRKRAAIVTDREGFKWLQEIAPWLNYVEVDSLDEALRLVDDHVEPYDFSCGLLPNIEKIVTVKPHKVKRNGKIYRYGRIEIPLPPEYIGRKVKVKILLEEPISRL